ncbi:MAG: hypothetical protein ACI97A_001615 [Planctomycetota bacterium]|jgi:hypothetical protein
MSRTRTRISSIILMIAFMLSPFLFVACGGGGSGSSGGNNSVLNSVSAIVGGTGTSGLPGLSTILRDGAIEFAFGGNIDGGIFDDGLSDGFVNDGTNDTVFSGLRTLDNLASTVSVPYFAYRNQTAARNALQILDNTMPGMPTHPGIIGRHTTKLNTLVFDPNVTQNFVDEFPELSLSNGFAANRQYDIFIPLNSGIRINGEAFQTFGARPPVAAPTSSNQTGDPTVFRTGPGFLTRPAPQVSEITAESLDAMNLNPATTPIAYNDTLIVRFTESIDPATVDSLVNLIVRNNDVIVGSPTLPSGDPRPGIIVPATIVADAAQREFRITPSPSFGGGPFEIELTISRFDTAIPSEDAKNLKGLPQGAAGISLPIQGLVPPVAGEIFPADGIVVASATFTTIVEIGEPTVASFIESFDDQVQFAAATAPVALGGVENVAEWALDGNGVNIGQLRGLQIDGTPIAPALGVLNPGARVQFALQAPGIMNALNPSCTTPLCSYASPFDDNLINNGVAPNGGGRLQAIYITNGAGGPMTGQLPGGLTDTFELVEWGTVAQVASPVTYNGFQIRAGHTTRNPINSSSATGLDSAWDRNYDLRNPQNEFLFPGSHPAAADPFFTPEMSPILSFGPAPYFTGVVTLNGTFIPYPRLTMPFDYRDQQTGPQVGAGGNVRPNVVFEYIVPEPHMTNAGTMFVNISLGTNSVLSTPFRRNFGRGNSTISFAKDPVEHHMRFTMAKQNSIATSRFYDTSQSNPTFTAFEITPNVLDRPIGTRMKIELASKNNSSAIVNESDWQTFVDFNGTILNNALTSVSGSQFLKARFTFQSNLLTNTAPFIDGFVAGFSFVPGP